MKLIIVIFHILICLFWNIFWYRTIYIHSEFVSLMTNHAKFSGQNAWFRILLSVLSYIIIIVILYMIYFPQLKIYYSLSDDKIECSKKIDILKNEIKCMKINYIIFIIIDVVFILFLILNLLVFSYVFRNSKMDLFISFLITLVIQFLPFIFVFFVTLFRFIGLNFNCPNIYNISLHFTI